MRTEGDADTGSETGLDIVDWARARRLTIVPFLHDGRCALIPTGPGGSRLALPSGQVLAGEDPMVDTTLRIPLATAGYRRQGIHPFAVDGDHVYLWCDGDDRYRGSRPHAEVDLWKGTADEAARRLRAAGDEHAAAMVEAADRARRSHSDAAFFRDNVRLMEAGYLRETSPQGGSGFGGTAEQWHADRAQICDAVDRDGTLLDVGCANGHLMESAVAWCARRGVRLEPYGVDLSAALIDEARRRLSHWADRFWVGNALDWSAPGHRRFDFVHTLLDLVPAPRLADMISHQLDHLVAPTGRLLVSHYVPVDEPARHPAELLSRLSFEVAGVTRPGHRVPATAWIGRP